MKHILPVLIAICFSFTAVNAQIAIKPSVGLNFTDFSKDSNTGKYKSKAGYQLGGSVAFGNKVYIEPGIFWVKKTTEYVTENTSSNNIKFDVSGFRIPVSIGFNLIGNEKSLVGLRAIGGASAFILTDAKAKNLSKDDFKNAAFGVFAGAGLDLGIVFLEAKYEWSLTNVQKDISQVDAGKSRSVFINAGVRIPL